MAAVIITQVKDRKEAEMLYSISKRFGKSKLLRVKSRENFYLAKLMQEAMGAETVSLDTVRKELRK